MISPISGHGEIQIWVRALIIR